MITTITTSYYRPEFTFGNDGKPCKYRGFSIFTTKLPSFSISRVLKIIIDINIYRVGPEKAVIGNSGAKARRGRAFKHYRVFF